MPVYRSIFGAYPDAVLLVDGSGIIRLSNPAADALLGYAPGELIGMDVDLLVPDSARDRHALRRQAYGWAPCPRPMGSQLDLLARRRDGSEVMVEIALSPLPGGQMGDVVVVVRSVGEYPRVRHALQRARYSEHVAQLGRLAVDSRDPETLLREVTEVVARALEVETSALYLLEPDRRALRVVAGFALEPGERVGTRIPNQPDGPFARLLVAGEASVIDDYANDSRATVLLEHLQAGFSSGLSVPLFDRGEVVGLLAARSLAVKRFGPDEVRFMEAMSNLLSATLQRLKTEEQLNHSQQLESVGQLTGGIAHDFNNLLAVIQGNLQALEESAAVRDAPEAGPMLAAASRAAKRGADLTRHLLAFSRKQVLSPSRIDVPDMLNSLAGMLRRTLGCHIDIRVDAPVRHPHCLADRGQLETALLNIAINARDAMDAGGEIRFACWETREFPGGRQDDVCGGDTGRYVAIEVADNGSGMPDAVKERAFEPFFTTKENGCGTGFGLSTVYGFIKQSRGAVTLDSEVGLGTVVTLYLPADAEQSARPESGNGLKARLPAGLQVLLVEDEPEVRAVARRFLESLGCIATPFARAEDALDSLRAESGRFDLLVTDVALGIGMRGTELARQACRLRPEMGVVLVSGFSDDLDRTAPDSWELLGKPYSRDALEQAMARTLQPRFAQDS